LDARDIAITPISLPSPERKQSELTPPSPRIRVLHSDNMPQFWSDSGSERLLKRTFTVLQWNKAANDEDSAGKSLFTDINTWYSFVMTSRLGRWYLGARFAGDISWTITSSNRWWVSWTRQ